MKRLLFFFIAVVFSGMITTANAKKVQTPKMYIFGMAASFNDTIVHFTNIQEIDSVWIEKKTGFLMSRELYSMQLRDFMASHHQLQHRTCLVVANKNKKKVEKKFKKFLKLYTQSKDKKQHYDVRYIDDRDFLFKPVHNYDTDDDGNAKE